MAPRLFRVCCQWLEQQQDWRMLAPRGGGLSASLATRHWLLRVYRRAFPESLSREDEDRRLELWLAEYETQILSDLAVVRRLTDCSMDEARRRRAAVTAGQTAECLVRAVAKGWLTDEPLGEMELEAVASTHLANAPSLERLLSREEFRRFEEMYEQLWDSEGAAHLVEHPYSRVMLGDDERPPLIRTRRENTWDALGRSVYSRFHMAAQDLSVPGVADDIAQAEVIRACSRLGLSHESALVLLYSLLRGLLQGRASVSDGPCADPDEDRSWVQEPGPITADVVADGASEVLLNGQLMALAEAVIRTFCSKQEQGRYLLRTEQMDRAHQHAMRRAWMDCFKQDRRQQAIDAAEARRIVTRAVFKGVPSGEAHLQRARTLGVVELTRPAEEAEQSSLADDIVNRACAWFAEHPEVALGLRTRDPERMEEYRRAAEEFGFPDLDFMMKLVAKESS